MNNAKLEQKQVLHYLFDVFTRHELEAIANETRVSPDGCNCFLARSIGSNTGTVFNPLSWKLLGDQIDDGLALT